MDYLEKKKRDLEQQKQEDRADYRALLDKLAGEKKLAAKDEQRLDAILSRLSIPLDAVERDVAILRRRAELTTATASRAEIVGNLAAIEKDADDYRDRETKALAELAAGAQEVNSRLAVENQRLAVVDRAADQLEALQGPHWELFGLPDPAVEARKRHLCQVIFGQPEATKYGVVEFEAVMNSPRDFIRQFSFDNQTEWVPAPGQSEAELQRLLAVARQLVGDHRQARYVLNVADIERARCFKDSFEVFDPARKPKMETRIFAGDFQWVAAPGQTDEVAAKYRDAITRKTQVRNDEMTTVLIGEPKQSTWATLPQA